MADYSGLKRQSITKAVSVATAHRLFVPANRFFSPVTGEDQIKKGWGIYVYGISNAAIARLSENLIYQNLIVIEAFSMEISLTTDIVSHRGLVLWEPHSSKVKKLRETGRVQLETEMCVWWQPGTRPADEDEVQEEMRKLIAKYKAEFPEDDSDEDEDEDEDDDSDLDDEEREAKNRERELKKMKKDRERQRRRREYLERHRKARHDEKKEKINQQNAALTRGEQTKKQRLKLEEAKRVMNHFPIPFVYVSQLSKRKDMSYIFIHLVFFCEKAGKRKFKGSYAVPEAIDPIFYGSYVDLENQLLEFRTKTLPSGAEIKMVMRKRAEPSHILIYLHNYSPKEVETKLQLDIQTKLARKLLWEPPFAGKWTLTTTTYRKPGYIVGQALQDIEDLRTYVIDYVIWDKENDFGRQDCLDELAELEKLKQEAVKKEEYFDAQDYKEKIIDKKDELREIELYYFKRRDKAYDTKVYIYGEGMGAATALLAAERLRKNYHGILCLNSALYIQKEAKSPVLMTNRKTIYAKISQNYIKLTKDAYRFMRFVFRRGCLKSPSNRVIIRRHFGGHGMNTGAKDLKVKAGDIIFIPYFKDCDRLPMRAYEELKLKSADDPEYCFRPRDIHKVKHGKASRYAKKYPTMTKLFGPLKETSELPRLASVIKHRVHQIEPIPWIPTGWPDPADPAPPVVEDGESSEEEMEEARPNPFEFMEAVYYDRKTDWDFDAVRPLGREELEEYFRHTWSQVNIQDEIEDPQELDATRKAFRERIIALNKTFRFYCASNVPVEFMTANQWMQFGVAVGIADRRDPAFSQIFVVTNASEAEEDKKDTQYEEDNPDNMFTFSEFTEALVRVGLHKYKDLAPHEAFKKIATKVLMNGDPQCMEDFNSIFNTPEIWKVYKKFARKTYNVFAKYAAGDKSQVDSLSSMDIKECFMFFKDSEIQVKTGLSRRSLIACFAMAQGIETDDEAGYESDYAEFIRMLGLLARETDPDKPIARSFQEFLEAYILPMKLPAY
eukprot:jgi/Bigna1/89508/estExt_fgenesh1_pg.C_500094